MVVTGAPGVNGTNAYTAKKRCGKDVSGAWAFSALLAALGGKGTTPEIWRPRYGRVTGRTRLSGAVAPLQIRTL